MYSQKSELGNDITAWKEYGPDPCGTTGMSYAAACLCLRAIDLQKRYPRCDSDEFRQTSQPHHVRLQDIHGTGFNQFAEAVSDVRVHL